VNAQVDRIYSMLARADKAPPSRPERARSPTMQDAIFSGLLWETGGDLKKIENLTANNAPFLRWIEGFDDRQLAYMLWLHREPAS